MMNTTGDDATSFEVSETITRTDDRLHEDTPIVAAGTVTLIRGREEQSGTTTAVVAIRAAVAIETIAEIVTVAVVAGEETVHLSRNRRQIGVVRMIHKHGNHRR